MKSYSNIELRNSKIKESNNPTQKLDLVTLDYMNTLIDVEENNRIDADNTLKHDYTNLIQNIKTRINVDYTTTNNLTASYSNNNLTQNKILQVFIKDQSNISSIKFYNQNLGIIVVYSYSTHNLEYSRTMDGGVTWSEPQPLPFINSNYYSKIKFINESTIYIITAGGMSNMVKSTDGGISWAVVNMSNNHHKTNLDWYITQVSNIENIEVFDDVIYVNANAKLFKSTDGGNSWIYEDFHSHAGFESICWVDKNTCILISKVNVGYAGDSRPVIYKTINCGVTWEEVNMPNTGVGLIFDGYIMAENDHTYTYIVHYYDILGQPNPPINRFCICKTTDGGNNWTTGNTVYDNSIIKSFIKVNDFYVISTASGKMYVTNNLFDFTSYSVSTSETKICLISNSIIGISTNVNINFFKFDLEKPSPFILGEGLDLEFGLDDIVLIKDQLNKLENGVYKITNLTESKLELSRLDGLIEKTEIDTLVNVYVKYGNVYNNKCFANISDETQISFIKLN